MNMIHFTYLISACCTVPVNDGADRPLLGTAASDLALYLHRNEVMEGIYDSDI